MLSPLHFILIIQKNSRLKAARHKKILDRDSTPQMRQLRKYYFT